VLVIGGEDLLTRLQLQALGHERHRLGGVSREHQAFGFRPKEGPNRAFQVTPIHAGRIGGRDPASVLGHRIYHHCRGRSERPVVQVDPVTGDQELILNEGPEGLVIGGPSDLEVFCEGIQSPWPDKRSAAEEGKKRPAFYGWGLPPVFVYCGLHSGTTATKLTSTSPSLRI